MSFLNDCVSKDSSVTELIIVESKTEEMVKRVRDRMNQAVMVVDASILQVENAEVMDLLDDETVKSLVATLGIGINLMPAFDMLSMERLRYGKVIIVTEPTEAGMHIQKQLIALVNRCMNPLIANGHLYVTPAENWSQLSDDEFRSEVMLPESRSIVPVVNGGTIF